MNKGIAATEDCKRGEGVKPGRGLAEPGEAGDGDREHEAVEGVLGALDAMAGDGEADCGIQKFEASGEGCETGGAGAQAAICNRLEAAG